MKTRKKKLRGMTLVECIIAIAVFAAMTLLLAMFGTAVEANIRHSRETSNKVVTEGPIAEAQNKDAAHLVQKKLEIHVSKGKLDAETGEMKSSGTVVTVKGDVYKVNPDVPVLPKDEEGNPVVNDSASTNKYDFQFVDVEIPEPTTKKSN
jgi:prepilin-type N-terminal cleavage/methylation domain-containing protein